MLPRSDSATTLTPDELRAWRRRRGITQREAAAITGYATETWKSYEQGRLAISPRLARLLPLLDGETTTDDDDQEE